LAAEGKGESINAQNVASSDDDDLRGKECRVDKKRDDDSEWKRWTLLFGVHMRRIGEHMEVLKEAMSKLSCDLQNYEEKRVEVRKDAVSSGGSQAASMNTFMRKTYGCEAPR
jgi:hypothetical protein